MRADIDLDPHEWRLKGTKRIKPFKPQPVPPDRPTGPLLKFFTWLMGIWCGICLIVVKQFDHADGFLVFCIAAGPFLVTALILILID